MKPYAAYQQTEYACRPIWTFLTDFRLVPFYNSLDFYEESVPYQPGILKKSKLGFFCVAGGLSPSPGSVFELSFMKLFAIFEIFFFVVRLF